VATRSRALTLISDQDAQMQPGYAAKNGLPLRKPRMSNEPALATTTVDTFAAWMNPMTSIEAHERLALSAINRTVYRPLDKVVAPRADSPFIAAYDYDRMIDGLLN
jgi:hypothetical protein